MWEGMTEEELDQMMDTADTSGNGTSNTTVGLSNICYYKK